MALTVASETQETDFCTFFMVAEGSTDISYVRNEDKWKNCPNKLNRNKGKLNLKYKCFVLALYKQGEQVYLHKGVSQDITLPCTIIFIARWALKLLKKAARQIACSYSLKNKHYCKVTSWHRKADTKLSEYDCINKAFTVH